jgi:hypothetical protein
VINVCIFIIPSSFYTKKEERSKTDVLLVVLAIFVEICTFVSMGCGDSKVFVVSNDVEGQDTQTLRDLLNVIKLSTEEVNILYSAFRKIDVTGYVCGILMLGYPYMFQGMEQLTLWNFCIH